MGGLCAFFLSSQLLQTQDKNLKKWMGEFFTKKELKEGGVEDDIIYVVQLKYFCLV